MVLPEALTRLTTFLQRLPGVGEKSARRMAFFLFQQDPSFADQLAEALVTLRRSLHPCPQCGNLTDGDCCGVCGDPMRERDTLCVVESVEDLMSLEQAGIFSGQYFVLGGRVSPLEGEEISPETLERLRGRIRDLRVREVVVATNPRIEGDLACHVVVDALADVPVRITRLAYGLPVGGSIGFADRVTLHAALESRLVVRSGEASPEPD